MVAGAGTAWSAAAMSSSPKIRRRVVTGHDMNQICGGRADMTSRGIVFRPLKMKCQRRPAFDFSVARTTMKCQLEKFMWSLFKIFEICPPGEKMVAHPAGWCYC